MVVDANFLHKWLHLHACSRGGQCDNDSAAVLLGNLVLLGIEVCDTRGPCLGASDVIHCANLVLYDTSACNE